MRHISRLCFCQSAYSVTPSPLLFNTQYQNMRNPKQHHVKQCGLVLLRKVPNWVCSHKVWYYWRWWSTYEKLNHRALTIQSIVERRGEGSPWSAIISRSSTYISYKVHLYHSNSQSKLQKSARGSLYERFRQSLIASTAESASSVSTYRIGRPIL